MVLIIKKTRILNGQATPPSSKSQSIRALILASMAQGESVLTNILHSDDTRDAIHVCSQLGANIAESGNTLTVQSRGLPFNALTPEIHSGNSGVTTHLCLPMLGLRQSANNPIILNCSEQMRARPINPLVQALTHLGLTIEYLENENKLPIRLSGQLTGGKTTVDGLTSQYLSALLFALPCASGDSEISVKNLQECSYVEMTLQYLREQNIQFSHQFADNIDTYKMTGRQKYRNFHTTISSDFSSASSLIAASCLISGEVILHKLNMTDIQGDKRLVTILQEMGADIEIGSTYLLIRGGRQLRGIKIDANDIPDLLPTLSVIGTYASGKTEIYNVPHARIKETDRIHSMAEGLRNMGAKIDEHTDGLTVYQSTLHGSPVKSYGDHRTVMALSIAGMIAEGTTLIDDSKPINKTFPEFITMMQSLGAKMEIIE